MVHWFPCDTLSTYFESILRITSSVSIFPYDFKVLFHSFKLMAKVELRTETGNDCRRGLGFSQSNHKQEVSFFPFCKLKCCVFLKICVCFVKCRVLWNVVSPIVVFSEMQFFLKCWRVLTQRATVLEWSYSSAKPPTELYELTTNTPISATCNYKAI